MDVLNIYQESVISKDPIRSLGEKNRDMNFCPLWHFASKKYSQNGEDGILYFLLQYIGAGSRVVVEMCGGDGRECNSANLILHHGFKGYLFDGDYHSIQRAQTFFNDSKSDVVLIHAWICLKNLDALFQKYQIPEQVDVLSLDMDGVDYWILRHILSRNLCRPRICVLEYQDILGPDRSLTVPYSEEFSAWDHDSFLGPNYAGASLTAFERLMKKYGYKLVGCEPQGFNAFFVLEEVLSERDWSSPMFQFSRECFFNIPKVREGMEQRYPRTKDMPWVEIDENGEPVCVSKDS